MVSDSPFHAHRSSPVVLDKSARLSTVGGAGLLLRERFPFTDGSPSSHFAAPCVKLRTRDWFHPDGFPIAVERREPQPPFGPHTHEFSEIVIVTGGRAIHVANSASSPISTGDAFVITGESVHGYRDLEDLRLINILFLQGHFRLDLWDLPSLPGYQALFMDEPVRRAQNNVQNRLRLLPEELSVVTRYADAIEAELRSRQPGYAFAAATLFMQLVGCLSRCYNTSRDRDSKALSRIAKAINHLEAHFDQEVNLETLAELTHMSSRSFLRAFQAATGSAPVTYLLKLRLNRAAGLLRRKEENVTSAAFKAGFNDSNYFARQFRKNYGLSPSAYRKRELYEQSLQKCGGKRDW
jgi:AraC-like DNA-binding protein